MGYYFEIARSVKDLSPEQRSRYDTLRSLGQMLPPELLGRIETIRKYIGPLTSGEIMSALEELVQDAFVIWVLAGEELSKVEWVDPNKLSVPTPPPTEEEKRKSEEWLKNLLKRGEKERKSEPKGTVWQKLAEFLKRWL